MIICKGRAELNTMREANLIVARVLNELGGLVKPDITTGELDRRACELIVKAGAQPGFKGYRGYPANICTSVNDQVIHGIPNGRRLQEGDIISIDVGVLYRGYYGDAAWTFPVGEVSPEAQKLLQVTREALYKGIEKAVIGGRVSDISAAVQRHVEAHGFSVVRDFVGHGVGTALHEEPQVPNYGKPGRGPKLQAGMVLAIEPMVNSRGPGVRVLEDRWTAVTIDGGLSAHFEHSVAITENGP
ncbi:MAG TPA: type I methionyl aminopeptidase, partial [Acidobacteriota bacterium]|nr:type I methionyl aminopeptidase [Acidobacteriota bacterium]